MKLDFLQNLNPQQQEAVTYTSGPSIILAGAGSGKTRVLGYKAAYLLYSRQATAEQILMLTFTNKAADAMKNRVKQYIDQELLPEQITATTFHSFCVLVLRRFGTIKNNLRSFVIFDENDSKDLIKEVLKDSQLKIKATPSSLLYRISLAKNQLLDPKKLSEQALNIYDEAIVEIYKEYQKRLWDNKALDFDDLLNETVNLLTHQPEILKKLQEQYRYLLVDEYQDTNTSQYLIAKLLAQKYEQITIVGDFSQSIYSWRGADFTNLEKFQQDFPEARVFNLEQNYRSCQPILDFAFSVIKQNSSHPVLKLWTNKHQGEEVKIVPLENSQQEALFVVNKIQELNFNGEYNLSEMAILYRTNAQSRIFEEICLNNGLPYQIYGGVRFYERREIKDLLSFLRYLHNPQDKVSLKRIHKLGKRRSEKILLSISKQDKTLSPHQILEKLLKDSPYLELYSPDDPEETNRLDNIKELVSVSYNYSSLTEFLDTVALVEAGYEFKDQQKDKIHLMTLHSAKGLEFGVVFIVGVEEGILPHSRSSDSLAELEEERRLFYVGITRAKDKLFITYASKRFVYGRMQFNLPSQFLGENSYAEY